MTETNAPQSLWDQLVGEELSGVVFVRDYLQLQFDPPPEVSVLSATVVVCAGGSTAKFGEEGFADLILSMIGRVVGAVRVVEHETFHVAFTDGSSIDVSLRPEDYCGPEAVVLHGRDGRLAVV
jgi:hypothetical protein